MDFCSSSCRPHKRIRMTSTPFFRSIKHGKTVRMVYQSATLFNLVDDTCRLEMLRCGIGAINLWHLNFRGLLKNKSWFLSRLSPLSRAIFGFVHMAWEKLERSLRISWENGQPRPIVSWDSQASLRPCGQSPKATLVKFDLANFSKSKEACLYNLKIYLSLLTVAT